MLSAKVSLTGYIPGLIPGLSICLLLMLSASAWPGSYSGSDACASCHEKEYQRWRESHHYQAMLPATAETVLGDFSDSSFEYAGVSSRFYLKNEKYYVETDNEKGELQEFELTYTFGFYPLQQYLVPFPRGRYQALNIAWDSRAKNEGGQRWIHLYPDEEITFDDGLHWTGSFQNWNSRCAACHSTNLKKNYNSSSDSYSTQWEEVNLGCEACHGPASGHLEWVAASGNADSAENEQAGFDFELADRGNWGPGKSTTHTFQRLDGKRPQNQVQMCAACHSRRSELSEDHSGKPFSDSFHLRLLESDLYFPDGQVNEEDYVYGSFLQSKMAQNGVVCSDCHDPHSNKVLAGDNSLCTQCHDNNIFNTPDHHHHADGGDGASCVNCHMPVKTYMVVDDRHDHSFRVPEPQLSLELGTPNTCNQCHQDRDAAWAAAALKNWGVKTDIRAVHAPILARARRGDASVVPDLLALSRQANVPEIIRATATLETANFPSQGLMQDIQAHLNSEDGLVRAAAVRSLNWLPAPQRYSVLQPLIIDPLKSVRMEVARQLSELPVVQLPAEYALEIETLRAEYLESLNLNADMPESQMSLGLHFDAIGNPVAAEAAYRRAIKLSPAFVPAMLNLADLYRANGLDTKAGALIDEAIRVAPLDSAAFHAKGLLLVRQGNLPEALVSLRKAALLSPLNVRYFYVYAVALYESGAHDQAISELESALNSSPQSRDLVMALASYYQQQGQTEKLQLLVDEYSL
jgi:predicted CXXCH cytochrome family protein